MVTPISAPTVAPECGATRIVPGLIAGRCGLWWSRAAASPEPGLSPGFAVPDEVK